jgi:hypothetical protein
MKDSADLLRAIAAIMWPVIVLIAVVLFRAEVAGLFARIRKAKVLGQEFELTGSLEELRQRAETAAQASEQNAEGAEPEPTLVLENAIEVIEREVLDEAARSPRVGLMILSAELERVMREMLTRIEQANPSSKRQRRPVGLVRMADSLWQVGVLPEELLNAVEAFSSVRNQIVHGAGEVSDREILQAIDAGLVILRSLQQVALGVVEQAGLELYEDSQGMIRRPDVWGVVLNGIGNSTDTESWIMPTHRRDYAPGQVVKWAFDGSEVCPASWYRHPETRQLREAWEAAAFFVGDILGRR